jgi:phosphomannomutase
VDVFPAYRDRIMSDIKLARPLKIVVDSGNGVAGASAPAIFRAIGCEVIELFSEVDGNFPNHHPDPSKPENLRDLIAALKTSGADLGSPSTATATAWASSRAAATTSTPTAR